MSRCDDDTLGFKRPPRWSRFKPGQSGNSKGRPKKQLGNEIINLDPTPSEMDEMVRAQLNRTITVNEGGKTKKMKMREVISQAQINAAAKGNVYAQKEVLKACRDLEARDAERALAIIVQQREKREEEIASYLRMVNYKKVREAEWAEAGARGTEPDEPWPHPDDILLFPNQQRWYPRGPFDDRGTAVFNWYRAERDYLFAYSLLERVLCKKRPQAWRDLYTLLWVSYDVKLPLRWQMVGKLEVEYFKLCTLTTKKLEAVVEQRRQHSQFLKILTSVDDRWDKESYKIVNAIMKPLLKRKGYRSLAEFDHAFHAQGEKMPWPKVTALSEI